MIKIGVPSTACIIAHLIFVANTGAILVDGFSTTRTKTPTHIPAIAPEQPSGRNPRIVGHRGTTNSAWTTLAVRSHQHSPRQPFSLFAENTGSNDSKASEESTAEASADTEQEDLDTDGAKTETSDKTDEDDGVAAAVANKVEEGSAEEEEVPDADVDDEEETDETVYSAADVAEAQEWAFQLEEQIQRETEEQEQDDATGAKTTNEESENKGTTDDSQDSEDTAGASDAAEEILKKSAEEEKSIFFATPKAENKVADQAGGLDLELIANVAGDIAKQSGNLAKDFLSVLRFQSANLLTSSLPDDQRDELLSRMGNSVMSPVKAVAEDMVGEAEEPKRASIQEEIAMARAEEAQKSKARWEREKEGILREMETAANARVENELKIQQRKLDSDRNQAVKEAKETMEAEQRRLEQEILDERARSEALAEAKSEPDEEVVDVEDLFAIQTDEEIARNKELEAILEKRQEQQAALEEMEEELRASVVSEEQQRDRLQDMLAKRQTQQEQLDTVEADLRKQVEQIEEEKARCQQLITELKAMQAEERELREETAKADAEKESSGSEEVNDDEQEITVAEAEEEEEESKEDLEHPVLGPVITDLGYKRIHFVSSGRLGTIPIWNRNRIYRNNRAKAMATEKLKTMDLGFPGVIGLHEDPNGKLSIIDGQHRVGMMAALKEKINKKLDKGEDIPDELRNAEAAFERVLVEVYPEPTTESEGDETPKSSSDDFAEKLFIEINKAEPVKLIDMPGVASTTDRKIIDQACDTLKDQYGEMFSSSQRCRVPNVNLDNLRSMIFGAGILKKHKLTTGKKLTDWLLVQNAAMGIEYESSESKQKLFSKKQWEKASNNNFYLGLDSSWLYK